MSRRAGTMVMGVDGAIGLLFVKGGDRLEE
jgi:hypothetical protein